MHMQPSTQEDGGPFHPIGAVEYQTHRRKLVSQQRNYGIGAIILLVTTGWLILPLVFVGYLAVQSNNARLAIKELDEAFDATLSAAFANGDSSLDSSDADAGTTGHQQDPAKIGTLRLAKGTDDQMQGFSFDEDHDANPAQEMEVDVYLRGDGTLEPR
jgi:hypothetical protein